MPRFRDLLFGTSSGAGDGSSGCKSPRARLLTPPSVLRPSSGERRTERTAKMAEKAQKQAEKLQQATEKIRNKMSGEFAKETSRGRSPCDVGGAPNTPKSATTRHTSRKTDRTQWTDDSPYDSTRSPFTDSPSHHEERHRTGATIATPSTAPTSTLSTEPSFVNLTASSFAPPISQQYNYAGEDPLLFPDPDEHPSETRNGRTCPQQQGYAQATRRVDDRNFDAFQQPYPPAAANGYPPQPSPLGYSPSPLGPYGPPFAPPFAGGYDPRYYMGGPRPMHPPPPPLYGWSPYTAPAPMEYRPPPIQEVQQGAKPWGYGREPTHLYMPSSKSSQPVNLERPNALWTKQRYEDAQREFYVGDAARQTDARGERDYIVANMDIGGEGRMEQQIIDCKLQRKFDQDASGKPSLVCRLGCKLLELIQPPTANVVDLNSTSSNVHRPPPPTPMDAFPRHLSSLDLPASSGARRRQLFSAEVITVEMLPEQRILYDVLLVIAQKQAQTAQATGNMELGTMIKAISNLRLAANSIDLLDVPLRNELRHLAQRHMSQLRPDHVDNALLKRIQQYYKDATKAAGAAELECPICLCQEAEVTTECNHHFHRDCLFDWLDFRHRSCPMCRRPIDINKIKTNSLASALDKGFTQTTLLRLDGDVIQEVSSNKITQAFKEIAGMHEQFVRSRNVDPNARAPKVVVLCSIKPMLVALSHLVAAIGLGHYWMVSGADQTTTKREIDLFRTSRKTSVLLTMPRAASNKIDLSFASTIFTLDPWRKTRCLDLALSMFCRGSSKFRILKFVSENSVETEAMSQDFDTETVDVAASKLILA